ncbi:MAG: UDP-4-amino-4,6-dideoxy-N-acetyl-beta-L-altrosamine transaminase [Rhodospirillaceae bacterium]
MPKNRIPPLPYGHQSIDEQDIAAVERVLRSDWITQGPVIEAFESAISEYTGARNAVAVSSGTAALHSACMALGIGVGDEVIVPTLTFGATAAAVRLCGAEVRFADVNPQTLGLSAETVSVKTTAKSKALIAVDFAGQPCDWQGVSDVASEMKLATVADAAHSLGAIYREKSVGTLADATCFSFHPVKAITSGEGGMIVVQSTELCERLRKARHHGVERDADRFVSSEDEHIGPWYYEIQELGLNYRTSDIHAALGLSQLSKLDAFLARRRTLAARYNTVFSKSDLLDAPHVFSDRQSAWHLYVIRLRLEALSWGRRRVFEELRTQGIGVQVHYMPLHLQPYYSMRYGHKRGDFPVAEAYYAAAMTLPLYPAMTDQDADDVIQIVLETLQRAKR